MGCSVSWQLKLRVQIRHLYSDLFLFVSISSPHLTEVGDEPLLLALFSLMPRAQAIIEHL